MVGLEVFTPVGVAFSRIAFGAVTLIILSLVTKTPLPPRWSWKYLFVASVLWVPIPWMLFGFGETRVSSALAGIINGATPLMALVAIVLVFPEEKPTRANARPRCGVRRDPGRGGNLEYGRRGQWRKY